jgi:DNA-binding transcriptional MerR regulator
MSATSGNPPGALAISEVARLTGLAATTLRIWQRRYGLGASRSSPGGHRRYSPLDVARLRAVQRLVGEGLPTGEAVRVVLAPVEHGLDLMPEADPMAHLLAAAALDLDGPTCRTLVHDHLAGHSVEETWEAVLRPVLGAVGERWAELPHGVAAEHVLSHVAAAALGTAIRSAPGPAPVLLACVPVEEHDLPLVALAAALSQRGVPSTLLGAATPGDAIAGAVARRRPAVVMLLALLPELADPGVLAALPPTDCLVAAGPGWDEATLPGGVRRIGDLPGALRIVDETLSPARPGP